MDTFEIPLQQVEKIHTSANKYFPSQWNVTMWSAATVNTFYKDEPKITMFLHAGPFGNFHSQICRTFRLSSSEVSLLIVHEMSILSHALFRIDWNLPFSRPCDVMQRKNRPPETFSTFSKTSIAASPIEKNPIKHFRPYQATNFDQFSTSKAREHVMERFLLVAYYLVVLAALWLIFNTCVNSRWHYTVHLKTFTWLCTFHVPVKHLYL